MRSLVAYGGSGSLHSFIPCSSTPSHHNRVPVPRKITHLTHLLGTNAPANFRQDKGGTRNQNCDFGRSLRNRELSMYKRNAGVCTHTPLFEHISLEICPRGGGAFSILMLIAYGGTTLRRYVWIRRDLIIATHSRSSL